MAIAKLVEDGKVNVITQNIDNLHQDLVFLVILSLNCMEIQPMRNVWIVDLSMTYQKL